MRNLIFAAAALAILTAPSLALAKTYDCAKPGNANKAQCKAAVVAAASKVTPAGAAVVTTAQPAKKPLFGKKPDATTTTTTATTAGGGSMKACASQWDKLSDAQKGAYKTQAGAMKSKSGGKLSGYNVFTGECMKKK
jgi:hypothetical protein